MIEFLPVSIQPDRLALYEDLFTACFPKSQKFLPETLRWLYAENPDGAAVGYDAFDGPNLAAHYVCIPSVIEMDGAKVRALLSLNTATHPKYQGQGLFTQLANKTYRKAADLGFHCVYGVANANSTPGFIRKLGFQLVEPLRAMIGVGPLGLDLERARRASQFIRVWSPPALSWRCSNPANNISYSTSRRQGQVIFQAHAFTATTVYAELSLPYTPTGESGRLPLSFHLYLGLSPQYRLLSYIDIPNKLRPSPLNLIYLPLSDSRDKLTSGAISFSFLDFDAY